MTQFSAPTGLLVFRSFLALVAGPRVVVTRRCAWSWILEGEEESIDGADFRWYTTKTEPSYDDMAIKLRRVIIAARFHSPCPEQATPQETRAVLAAWAAAGT